MDNRDRSILYQVAFKAAVEFVNNGNVETDDVLGEVFALADAFYEGLVAKIEASQGKASAASSPTSNGSGSYSGGSKRQASTPSGNTREIKNPSEPSSDAQRNYLKRLGYKGDPAELTKGEASDMIQQLQS